MEQETATRSWVSLLNDPLWTELLKPYLEGEKNRVFIELCSAKTPDERAILQGEAKAIADLLIKPQIEEHYHKQRLKDEEERANARREQRYNRRR